MANICNNCGKEVYDEYCGHCGQKADVGRLNTEALVHELWHGFTHTDKGAIKLWLDLLWRPRRTYESYFAGHRKHYFSPVVFFLVSFGVYIFLSQLVIDFQDHVFFLQKGFHYNDEYGKYQQDHAKIVALVLLPVEALLSFGLFHSRRNLAECIVFWLFCVGFVNTILCLLTPVRLLLIHYNFDYKGPTDYLLNWLAILIILVHALAVFGDHLINQFKVILMVFIIAIINCYAGYFYLRNLAKVPYPTFVEAVEETFTNRSFYFIGAKRFESHHFGGDDRSPKAVDVTPAKPDSAATKASPTR